MSTWLYHLSGFIFALKEPKPQQHIKRNIPFTCPDMLRRILTILMLSPCFIYAGHENLLIQKTVAFYNDTVKLKFVNNRQLFAEKWDTLSQVRFWKNIIMMPPDSVIINVASSRTPLHYLSSDEWHCQADTEKEAYRQNLRQAYKLDESEAIYVTSGKRDFYEFKSTISQIGKAAEIFLSENVDPWYAQTILLIESPGKHRQKSSAGALGPFQLMRSVAIRYGLKITKTTDERTSLEKSARAAARLLRSACIPYLKEYLTSRNISFNEHDLWFRLLVMHIYHAGWNNVSCMLNQINPEEGGIALFKKIWTTECRGFRNESQNYSQIALASIVLFENMLHEDGDTVFLVRGDRLMSAYKRPVLDKEGARTLLNSAMEAYQQDLLDGVIPFEYFFTRINRIQKELAWIDINKQEKNDNALAQILPLTDDQAVNLGKQLLRKRRAEDAVRVLKLNIERYPYSIAAYDSLGYAYRMLGKNDLAVKYFSKSEEIKGGKLLSE